MPAPIRQTPDGCKPALVSKFFSRRVERLDDSVGKENQRVARPQLQGGSFVSRIHFDSERKPSDFELLKRAVRPAQNRSEEHTSELQSRLHLVCRLLLEKKKKVATCAMLQHCYVRD